VLQHLLDRGGGYTRLDMIGAIKANVHVFETFSESSQGELISKVEIPRGFGGFVKRASRYFVNLRDKHQRNKRKYSLMKALDSLEKIPSDEKINSWESAKQHLQEVMTFELNDDSLGSENIENNTLLDNSSDEKGEESSSLSVIEYQPGSSSNRRDLVNKFRRLQVATTNQKIEAVSKGDAIAVLDRNESTSEPTKGLLCLDPADQEFFLQLERVEDERVQKRKHPAVVEYEEKWRAKEAKEKAEAEEAARAAEARERASSLMRPLTEEEQYRVRHILNGIGPPNEILAQVDADSVQRVSMQRLLPGQWLNDEVIHFFLTVLSKRDEAMCANDGTKKRSHFFKSYFMSKLLNEGHSNPSMAGKYEYRNVKRWSKKVPGKDIFNLDKICFPINQGGMHWVCAVAYMQDKRIHFYDSLGSDGMDYLEAIMQYVKDEHKDKKKAPLPNDDEWELVPCDPRTTPRQLNGFDCGVFTCMFIDFLSKDCPLDFLGQEHITQCRERIALSILNGTAIM